MPLESLFTGEICAKSIFVVPFILIRSRSRRKT